MLAVIIVAIVVGVLLLFSLGLLVGTRARRSARRAPEAAERPAEGGGTEVLEEPPPAAPAEAPVAPGEAPAAPPATAQEVAAVPAPGLEAPSPPVLRERLGRARSLVSGYLGRVRGRAVDETTFDELEEALLLADVGLPTTTRVLEDLREQVRTGQLERTPEALVGALRSEIESAFSGDDPSLRRGTGGGPTVWLFVGVNGVGKTTTIGKVAARQHAEGASVVMAAGDTFRAAAGEQLETWAERSSSTLIRGAEGADPSSVIFDAVQHAAARRAGLVLADTAGRFHTKVNLMEELKKVRRVAERPPGELTEVLLVLDATTGQNGLVQARQFTEAVGVTGVVLTKLDGTAKGGIVVAVRSELGLPIKLVGIGEGVGDLVEFDPKEFVAALFE